MSKSSNKDNSSQSSIESLNKISASHKPSFCSFGIEGPTEIVVDGNRLLLASQQLLAGFDDSKNYLMDMSSKEGYDGLFVYYVEHGCHELSSTTTRAIESLKRQIRTIETKTNRIQSSSIMKTMGQEFRKCGCCGERIQTSLIRGYLVSKLDLLQSNIQYGIDVQCPNCCSRSGYPFTEKEHDRLNDYKEKLASLKSRLLEKNHAVGIKLLRTENGISANVAIKYFD